VRDERANSDRTRDRVPQRPHELIAVETKDHDVDAGGRLPDGLQDRIEPGVGLDNEFHGVRSG
jgi:hypothetical protein